MKNDRSGFVGFVDEAAAADEGQGDREAGLERREGAGRRVLGGAGQNAEVGAGSADLAEIALVDRDEAGVGFQEEQVGRLGGEVGVGQFGPDPVQVARFVWWLEVGLESGGHVGYTFFPGAGEEDDVAGADEMVGGDAEVCPVCQLSSPLNSPAQSAAKYTPLSANNY